MTTQEILSALQAAGRPEKAARLSHFFKTGPGQYGEGDRFLGVTVPEQRKIAKKFRDADFSHLNELLRSPWHEIRLTGLLILTDRFERSTDPVFRRSCVDFYLAHTAGINSWDLVDLSCYKLLGAWLADQKRDLLYRLAASDNLWEQRIAIVSCMAFVRKGDFTDCLAIADRLLQHPHDLIRKAVGWLLRETGKKNRQTLKDFLATRYTAMPRTMLRYAIEHFPEAERRAYLRKPD